MSPVIRVTDSVFSRLQSLAQPFVDTPNSVIERLLDKELPLVQSPARVHSATPAQPSAQRRVHIPTGFNLYLAPASTENANATLKGSVRVDQACATVSADTCATIRTIVGEAEAFHCWAMTSAKREVFRQMKHGDVVLFSLKGTHRFDYRATVLGTLESLELGKSLWPATTELPWSLIYVLEDVERIAVRKDVLNTELGYDADYRVPGVIRVNSDAVKRAIAKHGSLDAVLHAAS